MRESSGETAFEGKLFDVVFRRHRREDGSEYERQVVEHPGAVGIVAYDESRVHLVRRPREAMGSEGMLEIPAGTMDVPGESEEECAARELREEVGLAAEWWEEPKAVHAGPGWSSETITIFVATGLSKAPGEPDEDERIAVVRVPLDELDRASTRSSMRRL